MQEQDKHFIPTGFEPLEQQQPEDTRSFFEQRMQPLGLTEDNNVIEIWNNETIEGKHTNVLKPYPIFTATEKGIEILVYSLSRHRQFYKAKGSNTAKPYTVTRLQQPLVTKSGLAKYLMPKGEPVRPFFPPEVVQAYDDAIAARLDKKPKQTIHTLVLTEGYFKAWKAAKHGIMCVGLPSITALKDTSSNTLHAEIVQLIETCGVERVVWLTDGDCRDITSKEIEDGIDLYKRPKNFFNSVHTFRELLSDKRYEAVNKYFAHVNSGNHAGKPKGLDDLLIALPDEVPAIVKELHKFDTFKGKRYEGNYFVKIDVTYTAADVHKYFFLNDVDAFYLHHLQERPDIANNSFIFNGTKYKFNTDTQKCDVITPGEASDYFRVGDDYYKNILRPDKLGNRIPVFVPRSKTTITDDHGKKIIQWIPRYEDFVVVPSHIDYQRVINSCFNMYHPFGHEPEKGECPMTLDFIKHIFGEQDITFTDANGKPVTMPYFELGLDYIQLLYQRPEQTLPILCLVSKENETGKTTFINWLNLVFGENMIIIGNADLQNDFNAHWASKLLIAVDETKIDKQVVQERLKSLSTATKISMNAKGKNQVQMDFFGKFILNSNNEDNFIMVGEQDIRYWVIKVPTIKVKNHDLVKLLNEEIGAFLHMLNERTLRTPTRSRQHFDPAMLQTDALRKLVKNSKSSLQKNMELAIGGLFEATGETQLTMPLDAVVELMKKPQEKSYIQRTLNDMGIKTDGPHRRRYPRLVYKNGEGGAIIYDHEWVNFNNRYYTFKREDFTDIPADENGTTAEIDNTPPPAPGDLPFPEGGNSDDKIGDLPF